MRDPDLERLLHAMDAMVGWAEDRQAADLDVSGELERVALRLECIARRLGDSAEGSVYLQFLQRSLASGRGEAALAASA